MTYTPFPTDRAKALCETLRQELDSHHLLDWEGEGIHSTASLFQEKRGHMFGVLLAKDDNERKHVIKAFSGQVDGAWDIPGWAPPCLDEDAFNAVVDRYDRDIHVLTERIGKGEPLEEERKKLSRKCQDEVFSLYRFFCLDGEVRTMSDAFFTLPPSGSGECCAPKLLSFAFAHGWKPVSMAEFFYGKGNASETRENGNFYPPCQERCRPLVRMMCGLDVVYADDVIAVVNKSAGMLSVPGNGEDKQDCVVNRLKRLFPRSIFQPSVHRLDMDTSGLLVYGLTKEAQASLSVQFATRTIRKGYEAVLDGILKGDQGVVDFAIRPDWANRPYQMYDPDGGKRAVTRYEKIGTYTLSPGRVVTRVLFFPETGRTHQIRVHSAFPQGLGIPIVGDRLYGERRERERLMLHAGYLEFTHPVTGERMEFREKAPF